MSGERENEGKKNRKREKSKCGVEKALCNGISNDHEAFIIRV